MVCVLLVCVLLLVCVCCWCVLLVCVCVDKLRLQLIPTLEHLVLLTGGFNFAAQWVSNSHIPKRHGPTLANLFFFFQTKDIENNSSQQKSSMHVQELTRAQHTGTQQALCDLVGNTKPVPGRNDTGRTCSPGCLSRCRHWCAPKQVLEQERH